MLHAEVFIYPSNKTGMFEYPVAWRDLVDGHQLKEIMRVGLLAAEAGRDKTLYEVELVVQKSSERIPLCSADIHVRVHDVRNYPPSDDEEPIESWRQLTDEMRARMKRWGYAPTVDELYLMVDAELPRIAQIGRFLHGEKVGRARCGT